MVRLSHAPSRTFRALAHLARSTGRKPSASPTVSAQSIREEWRTGRKAATSRLMAEAARDGRSRHHLRPPYMRVFRARDHGGAATRAPRRAGAAASTWSARSPTISPRRAPPPRRCPHGDAGLRGRRRSSRDSGPIARAAAGRDRAAAAAARAATVCGSTGIELARRATSCASRACASPPPPSRSSTWPATLAAAPVRAGGPRGLREAAHEHPAARAGARPPPRRPRHRAPEAHARARRRRPALQGRALPTPLGPSQAGLPARIFNAKLARGGSTRCGRSTASPSRSTATPPTAHPGRTTATTARSSTCSRAGYATRRFTALQAIDEPALVIAGIAAALAQKR